MARPIKETPILFGEDARRFEERMKEKRSETPEQREKLLQLGVDYLQGYLVGKPLPQPVVV
mgnify:FL=1